MTVWSLSSATNSFQSSTGEITIIPLLLFVLSKAIENRSMWAHQMVGRTIWNRVVEGGPFISSKLGIIVFFEKRFDVVSRERADVSCLASAVLDLLSAGILT